MGLPARIWMASRRSEKGHDVVFQVPLDLLGLPEEDHALRPVRQRVTIGVVLQISSPCHIRKLQWRLIALTVQLVESIVEVILVLKLADLLVSLSQDVNFLCPASQHSKSSSRKCEMRSLASPVKARHKSIPYFSEGTSVVLNHCFSVRR